MRIKTWDQKTWDQTSRNHAESDRWSRVREIARAVLRGLDQAGNRARERRQLAGLSEYQLRDIGISRAEAGTEIEKPFWRR